jgi:hypothetical protein
MPYLIFNYIHFQFHISQGLQFDIHELVVSRGGNILLHSAPMKNGRGWGSEFVILRKKFVFSGLKMKISLKENHFV